jgi:cell wall-associated protease
MKKFMAVSFVIAVITFKANTTTAQISALANTTWSGMAYVPTELNVKLAFGIDTLKLVMAENNLLLETMSYRLSNDTLFIKKLSGNSPCENDQEGIYKVAVKEKLFTIVAISDACAERSVAFSPKGYLKID